MTMILLLESHVQSSWKLTGSGECTARGQAKHFQIGAYPSRRDEPQEGEVLRVIGALPETDEHGEPSTDTRL